VDFLIYVDKITNPSKFPSVSASTSAPKTLYHAEMDLVYVNTGSGWQAMAQPGSSSVYSGYTSLDSTTKTNVLASVSNTSFAPHAAHKMVAAKTTDLINNK